MTKKAQSTDADWLVIAFLIIAGATNIAGIVSQLWGHQ